MDSVKLGRIVGALLLVQAVASVLVNFVWLEPVFAAPGFLVNAAAHPLKVGLSASVGLAAGALSTAIAIAAWPLFRRHSLALAMWLLVLSAVGLALAAVESGTLLSLLSLSQAYAGAEAANSDLFPVLRGIVAAARNWTHYIHLILGGAGVFAFYLLLLRSALVPRALAALGLATAPLQIIAVGMPLFGHEVMFALIMPLGLTHLALAAWLLAKGFAERAPHAVAAGSAG